VGSIATTPSGGREWTERLTLVIVRSLGFQSFIKDLSFCIPETLHGWLENPPFEDVFLFKHGDFPLPF